MEVAVLMSVFNRREKTLSCLRACYAQRDALIADGRYNMTVYMTEDGCTDGTTEAVADLFPEVKIIHGDGNLYWNRGMKAAWDEAAKTDPDYYLWLNDDTIINPNSLSLMLEISAALGNKAIVVGTAKDANGQLSYGGRTAKGKIVVPDKTIPVWCDYFNGNLVLVPRYVYKKIGTLDPVYSHSFGDFDYGVRAEKAGITSAVAPGILAQCDRNTEIPAWRDASKTLRQRYAALMSPKGRPFKEQFIYDKRSSGLLMATAHFFTLNLRVLFPLRRVRQSPVERDK